MFRADNLALNFWKGAPTRDPPSVAGNCSVGIDCAVLVCDPAAPVAVDIVATVADDVAVDDTLGQKVAASGFVTAIEDEPSYGR